MINIDVDSSNDVYKLNIPITSIYAISCSWNIQYTMIVDIKGQFRRRLSHEFEVPSAFCNFWVSTSSISWDRSLVVPSAFIVHVCNVSWRKYLPVRKQRADALIQEHIRKRSLLPPVNLNCKTKQGNLNHYQSKYWIHEKGRANCLKSGEWR